MSDARGNAAESICSQVAWEAEAASLWPDLGFRVYIGV